MMLKLGGFLRERAASSNILLVAAAASLIFSSSFVGRGHSLTCRCFERHGTNKTSRDCGINEQCVTDGVCYTDVRVVKDSEHHWYKYGCVHQGLDPFSLRKINTSCGLRVVEYSSAILCCDDTDFCNDRLRPENLLFPAATSMALSSTPAASALPTTSSSNSANGSMIWIIVVSVLSAFLLIAITITLVVILIYCRRKYKLRQECVRRSPRGMRAAGPNGEVDVMEMTMTSGSGSGLPFLIQRTVARSIKITEMIGNGRYGQVYLGYYQGEPVAVKKFFSRDEKSWVRETEIYNTLLLRHDNILGFFASDMVSNNGVTELWLITQYHQFGSLYDYLNREAVSSKVMLQMAISTCSGLAHLHTELFGTLAKPAIAHRDMKTKNVLVKNNRTCCIADFGLAVFKNQNEMNIPTNPKQGTKRYMAPEILNESINMKSFESFKQTDVYALGLVLWELCRRCTGKTGLPEDYEVPLQDMVPPDPSFEDMRRVVVMERRQPEIPSRWNTEELLREMTKVMKECWYYTSTARPTAVYLKKKLLKMSLELEKMNYGDFDIMKSN